ncbi:hypothetical protein [Leuconostoc citreum]|uniref:hypothetical protein n=1 Tax=Leuconostoc citreum TaxID=33964 RepID=UPI0032DF28B6
MRLVNFIGVSKNLITNNNNRLILQLIDEDVKTSRPQAILGSFNVFDYTKQPILSAPISIDKSNVVDLNFNVNPLNTLSEGVYYFSVSDSSALTYPTDTLATFSILEKGEHKNTYPLATLKDILASMDAKFANYSATVVKGDKGDRGQQGIQGIQGERGIQGDRGIQGPDGDKGDKGDRGPQGFQGPDGRQGDKGVQGEKGDKGYKGDKGDTGKNFNVTKTFSSIDYMNAYTGNEVTEGDLVLISTPDVNNDDNGKLFVKSGNSFNFLVTMRGIQGIKGDKGDTGQQGPRGFTGDKGDTGQQGQQGVKGDTGAPGKDSDVMKNKDNVFTATNTFANTIFNKPINGALKTKVITATDYNDIAKSMYDNAGIGVVGGTALANSPIPDVTWYVIQVMPGSGQDSGYIQVYIRGFVYGTGVGNGNIQGWVKLSDDSSVLHNTGNETSDGVKTFKKTIIGNISGNAGTANTLVVNDIADGTDLNSLRNAGNYSCGINKTSNTPVSGWFTLVVVQNGPYNGSQTLTNTNNGEVYIRTWINSGASFTDWHKLATSNEVVHSSGDENVKGKKKFEETIDGNITGSAVTAAHSDIAEKLTSTDLASGTDLNTILETKNYSCGDNRVVNSPVNNWFTLVVVKNGDWNGMQTVTNTNSGDMYVRVWNQGGKWFSPWRKVKFED